MSYLALAKEAQILISAGARVLGPEMSVGTPEGAALLASLLPMPLSEYARRGAPIALRVPWYGRILWLVPCDTDAVALEREGISRGRIWTAAELLGLFSVPGLTRPQVLTVALAKLEFTGEVVMVRSDERLKMSARVSDTVSHKAPKREVH